MKRSIDRMKAVVLAIAVLAISTICSVIARSPINEAIEGLETKNIHSVALPDGKPAMVAYMLTGNTLSDDSWRVALRRMRNLGVQVLEIGQISWVEMEPEPGQYKWGYAEKILRINKEECLGFQFVADIGMFINPGLDGKPKLPGYLTGKNFDDPQVIAGLSNLYQSFLALPGAESVKYLFNHFENAESSFKSRMDQRSRVLYKASEFKLLCRSFPVLCRHWNCKNRLSAFGNNKREIARYCVYWKWIHHNASG